MRWARVPAPVRHLAAGAAERWGGVRGGKAALGLREDSPALAAYVASRALFADAGLDFEALNRCSDYWEQVRLNYAPFDTAPRSGTADVYIHEMPGGQYTNLREQAESLGLGHRWPEIARMYADVNRAFGDIVKVTPSSKVVGDMALFLIQHGMTVHEFENLGPNHSLNIPNSVVEMFEGALGVPEGGWPPKIASVILKGRKPGRGRPGARLGKTTGWIHRAALKMKGVKAFGGVEYLKVDDAGFHVRIEGRDTLLPVDHVVICAGQEPQRELADPLRAAGVPVQLIGGADVAAELDAKRAIDQGTRIALVV